jgi:hypothetical protein
MNYDKIPIKDLVFVDMQVRLKISLLSNKLINKQVFSSNFSISWKVDKKKVIKRILTWKYLKYFFQ